jgi:hypothetical protein
MRQDGSQFELTFLKVTSHVSRNSRFCQRVSTCSGSGKAVARYNPSTAPALIALWHIYCEDLADNDVEARALIAEYGEQKLIISELQRCTKDADRNGERNRD